MGRIVDEIISKRTLGAKALKAEARVLKKINILRLSVTAIKYGIGFSTIGAGRFSDNIRYRFIGQIKGCRLQENILRKKGG